MPSMRKGNRDVRRPGKRPYRYLEFEELLAIEEQALTNKSVKGDLLEELAHRDTPRGRAMMQRVNQGYRMADASGNSPPRPVTLSSASAVPSTSDQPNAEHDRSQTRPSVPRSPTAGNSVSSPSSSEGSAPTLSNNLKHSVRPLRRRRKSWPGGASPLRCPPRCRMRCSTPGVIESALSLTTLGGASAVSMLISSG